MESLNTSELKARLSLVEQINIILEQHETELYYRTDGIAPEEYPKIAERIAELVEQTIIQPLCLINYLKNER